MTFSTNTVTFELATWPVALDVSHTTGKKYTNPAICWHQKTGSNAAYDAIRCYECNQLFRLVRQDEAKVERGTMG